MKLMALALDYDGTIAAEGVIDPGVLEALAGARRRGIALVLATGRRLDDLRRVAGSLAVFDAIVAENGAVLHFPESGRHVVLGHPPAAAVLAELERCGVPFAVGETVVETDGSYASVALETLRRLEQPLVLCFNRSRLMLLPQGISKSTGVRQALHALRLSLHNTIGIGDAENDHDLLDACEVGAAASWGSAALRAVADEVITGAGPAGAADYIRRVSSRARLSAAQMGRRRINVGHRDSGEPVSLALRGRSIFIAGEPGTGKSWLAGMLCEQLILQGYCMCLIDPEGDYRSLGALPGVIGLGGDDPPPSVRELSRALRYPDVSVLVDLSRMPRRLKVEYLQTLLPFLAAFRQRTGLPHKILIDEAHYYLADPEGSQLLDPLLEGYILVSYRISGLAEAVRTTRDAVVLVTRETDASELSALQAMCSRRPTKPDLDLDILRTLATNEAALLPGFDESEARLLRFRLGPRLTSHVRHRVKYLDMGVIDSQAFVFTGSGSPHAHARTLREFMELLHTQPTAAVKGHLERHDFSRWLQDVFRDAPLAAHVRDIEQQADAESPRDLADDIAQSIRARYEVRDETTLRG